MLCKRLLICILVLVPRIIISQVKTPVKDPCAPVLLLNGYKSGDTISKKDLSDLKSLVVYYPCTKELSRRIVGYMVTVSKGINHEYFHGFTHLLSSKILASLAKASEGTKIFIDLVVIRKTDLSTHNVSGLTLYVSSNKTSIPANLNTSGASPACEPIFYLGQFKNGSTISRNQLNLIKQASVGNTCNLGKKVNGCWSDVPYKSVSYSVTTKVNGITWSIQSSNNELPVEVREQFRTMKDSAQLIISDIKAKYEDGSVVNVPDITFKIVRDAPKEGVNNFVRNPRKK